MEVSPVAKNNSSQNDTMPQTRITLAEISAVRERHILRNLLYSPEEAGNILGKSARTILDLVKDGKLIAADDAVLRGGKGKASAGIRITAESLETYRQSIVIPSETWAE